MTRFIALSILLAVASPPCTAGQAGNALAIDQPLTANPGDPLRGRAIVASRQQGLCLLCHTAPIAEERFQGDLAPNLAGVGARASVGQLRARMIDSRRITPESIMPAYFRSSGFNRVGTNWQSRTLLDAQQIEDVVAWLATLK